MSRVLAVDLGGSRLRAAVGDAADPTRLEDLDHGPAPADRASLAARLDAALAAAGPVASVGIAVPGLVEGTRCRWIPNLPWLDGVDLAEPFGGLPVAVGNDAHIALLAEAAHGAARGVSDAILIAVGTGIGSAVLADGRIVRGAHGAACSFGWASADMEDGGDDTSGWLERKAAGRAFDRIAAAHGHRDGADLIAAARSGDPDAIRAVAAPTRALGTALAAAIALLDPKVVLLAGGVAGAADMLVPAVRAAARRHLPPHLHGIDMRVGAFGARAALVGAAAAARAGADWWRLA